MTGPPRGTREHERLILPRHPRINLFPTHQKTGWLSAVSEKGLQPLVVVASNDSGLWGDAWDVKTSVCYPGAYSAFDRRILSVFSPGAASLVVRDAWLRYDARRFWVRACGVHEERVAQVHVTGLSRGCDNIKVGVLQDM